MLQLKAIEQGLKEGTIKRLPSAEEVLARDIFNIPPNEPLKFEASEILGERLKLYAGRWHNGAALYDREGKNWPVDAAIVDFLTDVNRLPFINHTLGSCSGGKWEEGAEVERSRIVSPLTFKPTGEYAYPPYDRGLVWGAFFGVQFQRNLTHNSVAFFKDVVTTQVSVRLAEGLEVSARFYPSRWDQYFLNGPETRSLSDFLNFRALRLNGFCDESVCNYLENCGHFSQFAMHFGRPQVSQAQTICVAEALWSSVHAVAKRYLQP